MFETQGILGILVRHKLQIKDSGITDGDNDQKSPFVHLKNK